MLLQTRIFDTPTICQRHIQTRGDTKIIDKKIRSRYSIIQNGAVTDVGVATQRAVHDIVLTHHIELKRVFEVRESVRDKAKCRCHDGAISRLGSTIDVGINGRRLGQIQNERLSRHQPRPSGSRGTRGHSHSQRRYFNVHQKGRYVLGGDVKVVVEIQVCDIVFVNEISLATLYTTERIQQKTEKI